MHFTSSHEQRGKAVTHDSLNRIVECKKHGVFMLIVVWLKSTVLGRYVGTINVNRHTVFFKGLCGMQL